MDGDSLRQLMESVGTVAYFSMEIGVEPGMPTYAGGLGVLAGDTLRAAADLGLPVAGMTLLYRKGYFHQRLDAAGRQTESPFEWSPDKYLEPMEPRVSVTLDGRPVAVRAWRYLIHGIAGQKVPVYFLDAGFDENQPEDRSLTDFLYGGDDRNRLKQEALLGFGGVAMLKALGHERVALYHMNEGHSALLTIALLEKKTAERGLAAAGDDDREAVRDQCIFTTHTPVPAGHDQFPYGLVVPVLGGERARAIEANGCCPAGVLNMTNLALSFSRYVNGVAMRHGEVSRDMFPHYPIDSITNGVHALTWTSTPFRALYDHHIPDWRHDNLYLRHALSIPVGEIRQAHAQSKGELLAEVHRRTGVTLDPAAFTLGFARRATAYKRPHLLFEDPERLRQIVRRRGPVQIIYGGKAHPKDLPGKELISQIFRAAEALKDAVRIVYLEEYDMALAKLLCAGVDVWLNTPQKPHEASGTSGMKAAMNGVPSLSVLDGWWIEGHVEGVTGWAIGNDEVHEPSGNEVDSLYRKLDEVVLPLFYGQPDGFGAVMRSTIAHNGSYFNAQRMMYQYLRNAYFRT